MLKYIIFKNLNNECIMVHTINKMKYDIHFFPVD